MAIERLTQIDEVQPGLQFAVNLNGQDYRLFVAALVQYMQDNLAFPEAGYQTQYAAPATTAFTVMIDDLGADVHLILTPTGAFADGSITLPAPARAVDGQRVLVNCTQAVTTFAVNGNGGTVVGAPATLAANGFFTLKFDQPTGNWYRIG